MRKPPARVLYGLFGAKPSWIALAQNSLRSLGRGRKGCGRRKGKKVHFSHPLYTIIGRGKQCALPGKRMRALAIRLANYVKHDVCTRYARLPRGNRVASFIASRPPLCEINWAVRKRGSLYMRARREISEVSSPATLSHYFSNAKRNRKGGLPSCRMARLTVAISRPRVLEKAKLYVIAFFYKLLELVVVIDGS